MIEKCSTILLILAIFLAGLSAQGVKESEEQIVHGDASMIVMRLNDEELLIHLFDNPTSRDLVQMLPLTLNFKDYASTEKIAYLPRSSRQKMHLMDMNPQQGISRSMRHGEILRFSTGIFHIPEGLSLSAI